MRTPKLLVFCLLLTSLLGSGCMDILKEIYFNKDGSGTARIEYSLEGFLEIMEEMGGGADMGGIEISKSEDGKIEFPSFTEFVDELKGMPGISKVKYAEDSDASKVAVSFAFADLAAYNRAEEASGTANGETLSSEEGGMILNRVANKLTTSADLKMGKAKGKEGKMMMEMLLASFEGYTYTMKYTFEESVEKVKKNKNAEISADRKTVTVAADMADLFKGSSKMSSQIILE